jgi:sialate O-acetylesterase
MNEWALAAKRGHELGNHTLFHPCAGSPPGREWVNSNYDLDHYTTARFMDEIRVANVLLKSIDGKENRTLAYTCGDMKAGTESFYNLIKTEFVSARGVNGHFESTETVDLYNIGAFGMAGHTGEQMIELVQKAMNTNAMVVFLFHGVGGEHSLNVSLEEHNKLVHFLQSHNKEIWVPSFIEVSEFLKKD